MKIYVYKKKIIIVILMMVMSISSTYAQSVNLEGNCYEYSNENRTRNYIPVTPNYIVCINPVEVIDFAQCYMKYAIRIAVKVYKIK